MAWEWVSSYTSKKEADTQKENWLKGGAKGVRIVPKKGSLPYMGKKQLQVFKVLVKR